MNKVMNELPHQTIKFGVYDKEKITQHVPDPT